MSALQVTRGRRAQPASCRRRLPILTLFGDESIPATDVTFDISLPAASDPTESGETTNYAHFTALLATPREADGILNKYKIVVAWHARSIQGTSPPAKRRKACLHPRSSLQSLAWLAKYMHVRVSDLSPS